VAKAHPVTADSPASSPTPAHCAAERPRGVREGAEIRPITPDERSALAGLGQTLRRLRLARGLSQARLAASAGLHANTPSRIELGGHRLRPETLARLVRALVAPAEVDDVIGHLTNAFRLALAPSSPRAARIERRRDRRARRLERDTKRAMAVLSAIEAEEQRLARVAAQRRQRDDLRRVRRENQGDLYQPPRKRSTG